MPTLEGSVVEITYDGSDISNSVIYKTARFESQIAATPGTFEFAVRDPDRTLEFVTGKEITMSIDGVLLYGGYVTQVTRKFALPVDDTSALDSVRSRQWMLRGVDFNILFDKRVVRDTSNYLHWIDPFPPDSYDGDLVQQHAANYIDVPAGFDTTTHVDNVAIVNPGVEGGWKQQGTKWREQLDAWMAFSGAVFYFDANKNLIWRGLENSEAKWGFSDVPNSRAVTASPVTFQGATIGFRDMDAVEDGSFIVNDAFVWGGGQFTGPGGTVFSRYQAADSIAEHGRWQLSETGFGQQNYASQELVDQRAHVIVDGAPDGLQPGSLLGDTKRGLRFSQWQIRLAWFAHDVPKISGVPDHLRPGDLTTLLFYVLGEDQYHPLLQQLPLRQIRITFPTVKEDGTGYVRFDGFWSLQLSDPYTWWSYLLSRRQGIENTVVSTAGTSSGSAAYGSLGQFTPEPAADGTTTVFDLPNDFGYLVNTTQVYLNGILQMRGTHYSESDPPAGEITFIDAPISTDILWVICRTTAA